MLTIKLHGQFAKDYGPEHRIHAHSVAEAVEGFTRQVGFYEHLQLDDRPIVRIPGFDTEESLYAKLEQTEIHLVPAMIGGGGNFGKILIGAALIGVSFAIPGLGLGLSAALTSSLTTAFLGAGISMVLGGVMGFFVKAPSVSKDNDPEASKYLGLGETTVAIGTPIAIRFGRGPVTGHVLAVNVDSSEMLYGTFPANPI